MSNRPAALATPWFEARTRANHHLDAFLVELEADSAELECCTVLVVLLLVGHGAGAPVTVPHSEMIEDDGCLEVEQEDAEATEDDAVVVVVDGGGRMVTVGINRSE